VKNQYGIVVRVMPAFLVQVYEAVAKDRGEAELIPSLRAKLQNILHARRQAVKELREDELVRVANDQSAPKLDRECAKWMLIDVRSGLRLSCESELDLESEQESLEAATCRRCQRWLVQEFSWRGRTPSHDR